MSPTNSVGDGGFTSAGDAKTKAGYDKPLLTLKKFKKKIKPKAIKD